ncbi:MerR family DNA-binding transcriptional regulator [Micromonospora craniellae]|uniref:MerR family DNA-binding transcriptional regulator n=2 Tax=Micromonospora craniellae TaxID=2294034 RepID=A0A372G653_9ACTN|nr:MerR family DNA-binding transcriptional regulator [Micromonospora craniellae]RFS48492.1 MerR family DNA-binding transcriptional regulator [Micromonospora craniellae]
MSDPIGVSIGQAAALYGLVPSTLRWWEAAGVLPEPPRINGRRVYPETELRRIGLAYLCCVVGGMPLDRAALVTTGTHPNQEWRSAVREHAGVVQARIARLRSALGYLAHLTLCPDDNVVRDCEHLDEELSAHTPRGLLTEENLVMAARTLPLTPTRPRRDETTHDRDEIPAASDRCTVCAGALVQPTRGRRRIYCSSACRQVRYRTATRHPAEDLP